MHLSNVANVDELHAAIVKYLRDLGIKYRLKKNGHTNGSKSLLSRHGALFKRPLHQLATEAVNLSPQTTIEVPCFLLDACNSLRQNVETEGIFRKGGSTARQKEIKAYLDKSEGNRLHMGHHEIDIANMLKLFLRELPEPLLPSSFQDVLLRCLLLNDKKVEAILHACLLLPLSNINTLAYFMTFLSEVASHSEANKMDVRNLAIVISPSVMPLGEKMTASSSLRLSSHVQVIEVLIQHAGLIGVLPGSLREASSVNASVRSSDELSDLSRQSKKKKGRRSGSLTRMLNGFKKMVGKGAEEVALNRTPEMSCSTPCVRSGTKRKVHTAGAFSAKKKRDVLDTLPQKLALGTPVSSHQLPGNQELYHLTPSVCQHPNPRRSKSPATKSKQRRFFTPKPDKYDVVQDAEKKSRLSLRARRSAKKQSRAADVSDLPALDRRWSSSFFARKKRPSAEVSSSDSHEDDLSYDGVNLSEPGTADSSEDDFVRIPKSEYEAIKNRVSAIENKISQEFTSMADSKDLVQCAYERTLEESTTFDGSSTDQLAKRLSRELKIRRSAIRSPSLRKIGSLRRRSRETGLARTRSCNASDMTENQFYPRPSLRRGRPNTVLTGLPQPSPMCSQRDARIQLSYQAVGAITRGQVRRASSFHGTQPCIAVTDMKKSSSHAYISQPCDMNKSSSHTYISQPDMNKSASQPAAPQWTDAQAYFKEDTSAAIPTTGRASIARIRSQNAGMVMQRTRLFDGEDGSVGVAKAMRVQQLRDSAVKSTSRKQSTGGSPKKIGSPRKQGYSAHRLKLKNMKPSPLAAVAQSNGKENVKSPCEGESRPRISFSPQMSLPDNLKETIYDVCTPAADKPASKSPLKDCNRAAPFTPFIKQPLLAVTPRPHLKTPQLAGRRLLTPMRAITPLGSPRRQSPRLLLKSRMQLNTP